MYRNDNNSHLASLLLSLGLLVVQFSGQVHAWGNKNNNAADYSIYGNSGNRDWLYDGSVLSIEVLGCVWGVVYDSEEAGCLEDESEDGTYNWYMMANCRRPQVAYSVYASDSGSSSCSSSAFVGSVSLRNWLNSKMSFRCHMLSLDCTSILWRLECVALGVRF